MSKMTGMIITLVLAVVTLVSLSLGMWSFVSSQKIEYDSVVVIDNAVQSTMGIKLEDIAPDTEEEYSVLLKANKGDKYQVTANFEKAGGFALAKFLNVYIVVDGKEMGGKTLFDYLNGESIAFDADFAKREEVEVKIVYRMDKSVGDEAQNTIADFKLIITAQR